MSVPKPTKQRFASCWPHVLKWLKAVFHGRFFHGDEDFYVRFAFGVYNIACFVCEDLLEEDGAFEFAVTVWIGHVKEEGAELFSVRPLLAYMSRGTFDISRIDHLLNNYDGDTKRLADQIFTRLETMTYERPTNNANVVTNLTSMIRYLADVDDKSIRRAIFTPTTGQLLVSVASSLMNYESPIDYLTALRSLFHLISACNQLGASLRKENCDSRHPRVSGQICFVGVWDRSQLSMFAPM